MGANGARMARRLGPSKIQSMIDSWVHSGRRLRGGGDAPAMRDLWIELDGDGALHRQAYRGLRDAILSGRLRPGAKLPSSRGLARALGLSRNTAIQAFQQLLDEGYAVTRRGAGTFVAEALPEALLRAATPGLRSTRRKGAARGRGPPRLSAYAERALRVAGPAGLSWSPTRPPLAYDFRYGEPPFAELPLAVWTRALHRRLRKATRRDLGYGPPGGAPELRRALAEYLARSRGVRCRPEQVLVVRGAQQAIDLCGRVLVDPGDVVAVEDPGYPGFRRALEAAGARLAHVPVDEAGLPPGRLPEGPARGVCVTPSHQFPTGGVMPVARRLALLDWAARRDAFVLEDDYDGEFRYGGRPLASLQGLDGGERVVYVGSFSKLLFPALRVGYAVVPDGHTDAFLAAQALADTGGAQLDQRVLADFVGDGSLERHLRRARVRNAARREALLEALDRYLGGAVEVAGAHAGLHVVVWLPGLTETDASRLRRRAAGRGVGVYSVRPFCQRAPSRPGLVLGYASLQPEAIREGVRLLAVAFEETEG